jgi:hypothetical protein
MRHGHELNMLKVEPLEDLDLIAQNGGEEVGLALTIFGLQSLRV